MLIKSLERSGRATRFAPAGALAAALVALGFTGCLPGSDNGSPREERRAEPTTERLAELGLVSGPPANVAKACTETAGRTRLTVYCPPIVPEGPVKVQARGTFGRDRFSYFLSFESRSLVDRERARASNPQFPYHRNRPRTPEFAWHPYEARHWVVAALKPARDVERSVDQRVAYPRATHKSKARRFSVDGVRATVLTGDIAGYGLGSANHAIVIWQIDDVGYLASVHYDHQTPVAKKIARGLINQMVDCDANSVDPTPRVCDWVFVGQS